MWWGRNEAVFNKAPIIPYSIVCVASAFASATLKATPETPQTQTTKYLIWVSWIPPHSGSLKLNVDGSSILNPGYAGLGGVFRNWVGDFVLGYARAIHVNSNKIAKMWVVHDGLWIARRFRFAHLIIETDSVFVYNALCRKQVPAGRLRRIV